MNIYLTTVLGAGPWPREPLSKRVIRKVLTAVLPNANPDFEHRYPDVRRWLLELDAGSHVVKREIGLDADETPIVAGPIEPNYGFWTDSEEPLDPDGMQRISSREFEAVWERFRTAFLDAKKKRTF